VLASPLVPLLLLFFSYSFCSFPLPLFVPLLLASTFSLPEPSFTQQSAEMHSSGHNDE
jgi:hypothetical protein